MEGHGGGLVIALRRDGGFREPDRQALERVRRERRPAARGRALGRDRTAALRHGGARARAHALGAGDPRREHPGHRRAAPAARQRPRPRRPGGAERRRSTRCSRASGTEIDGLRHLITELRPAALDDLGLAAALEALARRAQAIDGLDVQDRDRPRAAARDGRRRRRAERGAPPRRGAREHDLPHRAGGAHERQPPRRRPRSAVVRVRRARRRRARVGHRRRARACPAPSGSARAATAWRAASGCAACASAPSSSAASSSSARRPGGGTIVRLTRAARGAARRRERRPQLL